jgi:hypothetical protein
MDFGGKHLKMWREGGEWLPIDGDGELSAEQQCRCHKYDVLWMVRNVDIVKDF